MRRMIVEKLWLGCVYFLGLVFFAEWLYSSLVSVTINSINIFIALVLKILVVLICGRLF